MNIFAWFGTDFKKLHIMFFSQYISFFIGHLPFIFEITFGGYQDFAYILWRIVVNLFDPVCYVVERSTICDGIGQHNSCCTFVVCLRDISESLLTGSIPNLHFYSFIINIQHFYLEVDTNSCDIVLLEYSLAKVCQ